ncbi:magnesium chelatase family protein [Oikeobacillus pervagus]|uniref:Magnesium chelatase family protein n=1 Tax=Oikeobacillus pervagus TaxID=1325931 RepID=A0AAJ1T4U7_9BACI|nr:YifB family Mg chelatase-like AAA ATPase [Oikeobacillus pervagus]MDQ0215904.1 magnesium chelatase family protein [Oikeobacillus pervagus]
MTVKISSIGLKGLEGYRVQVEVQISPGLQSMVIVGLPDASVKGSKERVLSAVRSLECGVEIQKIAVNLSPSEQKKNGPLFDLAMVIGILKEMNHVKVEISQGTAFIGALSLDGTIEKVEGMLPALIAAAGLGFNRVFLPYDPLIPFELLEDIECIVVHHIQDVLKHLSGQVLLSLEKVPTIVEQSNPSYEFHKDFYHIIGHEQVKQALEIAATGGHNVLMSGPPGCGKSLLAESFPSILPPLTKHQQLEVISLYQLAKEKLQHPQTPPYRHPHHSASSVAIIGGGSYPRPGEISLAHHGVLFLDEMAEFTKKTLDMLRQPLETGKVTISRVHSTVTYPASFILVGAMNPCPCGYLGSNTYYCTCTPKQVQTYRNRVSGPVYDRIDLLLSLKPVNFDKGGRKPELSSEIRRHVMKAQERQFSRYQEQVCNAKVPFEILTKSSPLTDQIAQVSSKQHWSNRVQIKIIRLTRTISDLSAENPITDESIWKAIQLRWNLTDAMNKNKT